MIILRRKDYSGVDPISGVTYKSAQVGLDTIDKGVKIAKSNEEFLGNRTKRYINEIDTTSRSLRKLLGKRKKNRRNFPIIQLLVPALVLRVLLLMRLTKEPRKPKNRKQEKTTKSLCKL